MKLRRLAKISLIFSIVAYVASLCISNPANLMGFSLSLDQALSVVARAPFSLLLVQGRLIVAYWLIFATLLLAIETGFFVGARLGFWQKLKEPTLKICILATIGLCIFALLANALTYPQLYSDVLGPVLGPLSDFLSSVDARYFYWPLLLTLGGLALLGVVKRFLAKFDLGLGKTAFVCVGLSYAALVITLFFAMRPSSLNARKGQKIVIWYAVDSLRTDMINPQVMPNLAKIAASGVHAREHHIVLPRTFPSFAAMLTGKYPVANGIRHMFPNEADVSKFLEEKNLIAELSSLDVSTGLAGDFAADFFYRLHLPFTSRKTPEFNLQSLLTFQSLKTQIFLLPFVANSLGRKMFSGLNSMAEFAVNDFLCDDALDSLSELAETRKDVFLIVFSAAAHFPYASPYPFYRKFSPDYQGDFKFKKFVNLDDDSRLAPREQEQIRSLYRGALASADQCVFRLKEALTGLDNEANTALLVFGDHGENLYEASAVGASGQSVPYYQGHGEHLFGNFAIKTSLIIDLGPAMVTGLGRARVEALRERSLVTSETDLAPITIELLTGQSRLDSGDAWPLGRFLIEDSRQRNLLSETGIWFSPRGDFHFQRDRYMYPDLTGISRETPSGEIVVNQIFSQAIEAAKHRSLDLSIEGERYRLIYQPTPRGARYRLFKLFPVFVEESNAVRLNFAKTVFERELKRFQFVMKEGYVLPSGLD